MSHGFIYDRSGEAFAIRVGDYLFGMDGYPLAWIQSSSVFTLEGDYAGELYRDMVVDQMMSTPASVGKIAAPGRIPPPDRPLGRGTYDYGYPDASERLRGRSTSR